MNKKSKIKNILKSANPLTAFMAAVSVALISNTTYLIFVILENHYVSDIIFMLVFASIALAIIVAIDLVYDYECKQTQEKNAKQ